MVYEEMFMDILWYIEDRLTQPIELATLAARAGFSPYHFSRVFRWATGHTVMSYIRQRRLLHAAAELSNGRRIIDIALDYGFETHSGFSRAFRRMFGCSPETYRTRSRCAKPAPPALSMINQYQTGGVIMEPEFISRPDIRVCGYSIETRTDNGENQRAIPEFWQAYMQDGRCQRLHREPFLKAHAEYGACFMGDGDGEMTYMIGVEAAPDAIVPETYDVRTIPAATYAVFSTPPTDKENFTTVIQSVWSYIFSEWFPASGYEYADGCTDFELYDERCAGDTGNVCEIYLPVVKRA
ncbi:MAG: AraC family transcriptional regulator [Clostridia bacterium]|nr:AraC family transcriptional regulator [Clostridia bacterium]